MDSRRRALEERAQRRLLDRGTVRDSFYAAGLDVREMRVVRAVPDGAPLAAVLCDSGEDLITSQARTVGDVIRQAESALDHACLANVVVVQLDGGRFLVGEFAFVFREVGEEEAFGVARDFDPDRERPRRQRR